MDCLNSQHLFIMIRCSARKIGVICCTNGGVFRALHNITGEEARYAVVTDRACGVEAYCEAAELPVRRIDHTDRNSFAENAALWLSETLDEPDPLILLFFLRLVGPALTEPRRAINLHPSLLPAFPGFGAIEKAKTAGVRFLGATAHVATEDADAGPIIGQCAHALRGDEGEAELERLSFLQKTYLSLSVMERADEPEFGLAGGLRASVGASPALERDDWREGFRKLAGDALLELGS